jgi:hypothetical protein
LGDGPHYYPTAFGQVFEQRFNGDLRRTVDSESELDLGSCHGA